MNLAPIIAIALIVPLPLPSHAGEVLTTFSGGRVQLIIPETFMIVSSENNLVTTFGSKRDHKLELKLNDQGDLSGPADYGESFVIIDAVRKGLNFSKNAGKAVSVAPPDNSVHGKIIGRFFIGFGRSVVEMTLTAPDETPMSPELQEFLAGPINVLVESLRLKEP